MLYIRCIETSCDDTGAAVYDTGRGLLADKRSFSQVEIHQPYGGVVPELAARDHMRKLLPLLQAVLADAGDRTYGTSTVWLTRSGPGLVGALLVGAAIGRSLALALSIPAVGVHHMEGHLLAPMLEDESPAFPFLALLVSGGHTLLVDVRHGPGTIGSLARVWMTQWGRRSTRPPSCSAWAIRVAPGSLPPRKRVTRQRFRFPRPMTNRPGLDFSFSGLKTHTLGGRQGS